MATRPKRELIDVKLPEGFDVNKHVAALTRKIVEERGPGWDVENINPELRTETASRMVEINEVTERGKNADTIEVKLTRNTKPSDGDKFAAKSESQHEGYFLTEFEPFLGYAILTKLTPNAARARGAISVALGVKPWDVQIAETRSGGYEFTLPRNYIPSKHFDKLQEVAEAVVGQDGWYVTVNAKKLRAEIVPSAPPTFPHVIPYPFAKQRGNPKDLDWVLRVPLGITLGYGENQGDTLYLDLDATPGGLVAGTAGSGKAQPLSSRVPVPISEKFPSGWAVIGELGVGDFVFGVHGRPVPLVGFSDVSRRPVFDVHFSDGQVVRTTGDHGWRVQDEAQRDTRTMTKGVPGRASEASDVARLRAIASAARYGVGGTAPDLARLTGLSAGHILGVLRGGGISQEVRVIPANSRAGAQNRLVGRYDAKAAVAVLTRCGFGTSINPVRISGRLSARDLSILLGTGDTKDGAHKVRTRLRRAGLLAVKERLAVEQSAVQGNFALTVYPVGEAVTSLADHREQQFLTGYRAPRRPPYSVRTTSAMAAALTVHGRRKWSVDLASALELPHVDLPVDPYTFGAWLGDGTSRVGSITSMDSEIIDRVVAAGYPVRRTDGQDGNAATTYAFDKLNAALVVAGVKKSLTAKAVKRIPAAYLRASVEQRLALLQGLMDTDGSIDPSGSCELTLCDEMLATDALDLIRTLGIRASMTSSPATITEVDPDNPGQKRRRVTGTRYRTHFTTTQLVFALPRKVARLNNGASKNLNRLYITNIVPTGIELVRCLRVDDPNHLYLTEGYIATHNTVGINSFVYGVLARGAELVIADLPHKSIDFTWAMPFCRPGGFGCSSTAAALTSLAIVYEEGERRAKLLRKHNVQKWQDLPVAVRPPLIVVVVDEVTGLFGLEEIPRGLPKDHPLVTEAMQQNLETQILKKTIAKIPAEMRFVGIRIVLATQMAQANTGISVPLKTNLANRILFGSNPNDAARGHALLDPRSVPKVPDNIRADSKASRGVGVAELEGQGPVIFKSFFATTDEYAKNLHALGAPTTNRPEPTSAEIAKYTPSLDAGADEPQSRIREEVGGFKDGPRPPRTDGLTGSAAAGHDSKVEAEAFANHQEAVKTA